MRMLLANPQIGLNYIAGFMDDTMSERLLRLAHDESVTVRRNTAKIASQITSPIGKTILHNLVEDRDAEVRNLAHQGLVERDGVDEIIEQLSDSDTWREAGARLIEIGEPAVQPLILALGQRWPIWERAALILRQMAGIMQEELSAALRHENPLIRERVSAILQGETGDEIES
jgi:hypothetical protein